MNENLKWWSDYKWGGQVLLDKVKFLIGKLSFKYVLFLFLANKWRYLLLKSISLCRNTFIFLKRQRSMITGYWVQNRSFSFVIHSGTCLKTQRSSPCHITVLVIHLSILAQEAGSSSLMGLESTINWWTSCELNIRIAVMKRSKPNVLVLVK